MKHYGCLDANDIAQTLPWNLGVVCSLNYTLCNTHAGDTRDTLPPVSDVEVLGLISAMSSKSPPRDFTPISLLKRCKVVVAPLIARLANLSSGGSFPDCFKIARITSLLKGHDLDSNNQASYQPISNLNTISKLLERLVLARPQGHTINSRDVSQLQSEYRRHNSTETAVMSILGYTYQCRDAGKINAACCTWPVHSLWLCRASGSCTQTGI